MRNSEYGGWHAHGGRESDPSAGSSFSRGLGDAYRHMDATVEFLWSRRFGLAIQTADWAIHLLEFGNESDAVARLTDRHVSPTIQEGLVNDALSELEQCHLLDLHTLKTEYERESIGDYFAGSIDGWTLIRRCCDLHYLDEEDDPDRHFWICLADDADQHGGQRICLQHDFVDNDFDTVLQEAIRGSGRPLPPTMT